MNFFKRLYLGMTDLPGYGPHPGTPVMAFLIAVGFMAGANHGVRGALLGGLVMILFIVPLYLAGANDRARMYLRDQERKNGGR